MCQYKSRIPYIYTQKKKEENFKLVSKQKCLPPQKSVTSANSSDLNRLENVIAKFDE